MRVYVYLKAYASRTKGQTDGEVGKRKRTLGSPEFGYPKHEIGYSLLVSVSLRAMTATGVVKTAAYSAAFSVYRQR